MGESVLAFYTLPGKLFPVAVVDVNHSTGPLDRFLSGEMQCWDKLHFDEEKLLSCFLFCKIKAGLRVGHRACFSGAGFLQKRSTLGFALRISMLV